MERLIFHIDVNSAFLSWESARRVSQGLPDLREIPPVWEEIQRNGQQMYSSGLEKNQSTDEK